MPQIIDAREKLRGLEERIFDIVSRACTPEQWLEWLKAPLELAAAEGDEILSQKLVEAGARSGNVLHEAVRGGQTGLVTKLLDSGASLSSPNFRGSYPLHYAAAGEHGSAEVVRLLISRGADVNVLDSKGRTPLHWAADCGHVETGSQVAEALLTAGADIGLRYGRLNKSAMHLAARNGHTHMLRVLEKHGGDVNDVDVDGHTPLHYAALTGNVGCIDLLIQEWADIEAVQSNGDTPLYSAVCGHNSLAVVLALLKHGADANIQNWRGESPIFYAATYAGKKGTADVVDALLRWGADPLAMSSDGKTAANVVAERVEEKDRLEEDVERVRELLERA